MYTGTFFLLFLVDSVMALRKEPRPTFLSSFRFYFYCLYSCCAFYLFTCGRCITDEFSDLAILFSIFCV